MPLVDGQIDRLADGAAGMVDEGREIGELHEILEVFDRAVAAALVEIVDEGRTVVGGEDRRFAADDDVALGIARMLHIARRRRRAELPRKTAGKADALALDVAARVLETLQRAGIIAKFDPDLLQQRVGVVLDQREALLAEYLGRRDRAGYVGDRREAALRARRPARLAAPPRLGRGEIGRGRGRHGAVPWTGRRKIAPPRGKIEPRKCAVGLLRGSPPIHGSAQPNMIEAHPCQ